jgi:hypothetical protein
MVMEVNIMKEENKFITFIKKLFGRFKKKDPVEEKRKSDEAKREMCKRAIQSCVCPHACEICAWNVRD